jgi:4'-phosphopantetheinyl transferase
MLFPTAPDNLSGAPYIVALATSDEISPGALTADEACELDRLPHDERRRDWLAGRCAAKRAVAAYRGLPAESVRLVGRPGAAPRCFAHDGGRWAPLSIAISIAHCHGVAIAAAFGLTARVGVDVEPVDAVGPDERRYFATPSETGVDAAVVWVLKEAAWKALGIGSATPFTALELRFDPRTAQLREVCIDGVRRRAHALLTRVPARRELVAAVVEIDGEAA